MTMDPRLGYYLRSTGKGTARLAFVFCGEGDTVPRIGQIVEVLGMRGFVDSIHFTPITPPDED